ncbi:sigma-70 family RNA polymerase sigma factor [Candidatus Poribacteria bacterium]|nr:sigma-70 family RNA polymerase sigma factor [Candidatus Poribacteria bacterium]
MKFENSDKISKDILFIRQTLLGNKAAFEKLVNKYRPAIYALALSYAKNAADAEDLTQEVFIKAYQNLACLKNLEQFPFWLRRIAHNHCKNWLKRRGERLVSFEEVKVAEATNMALSPEEMALKQELREIVWQAIDSLLEIDRKLIEARYLEDASLKQLQADYGLSYCAVAGRLKRAKQKVRETVQKALMGFCALPGREVLEKILLGGIEVVKLSLKTKLVTVATIAVLGLGGAGVWHWHSNEASPKSSGVQQQKVNEKKAVAAGVAGRVQIPKPMSKVAQGQPAKSSQSSQGENISDEEWANFKQRLAEPSEDASSQSTDLEQTKEQENEPGALALLEEEIQEVYQILGNTFQHMREIREEARSLFDEYRQVTVRGPLTFEYEKAHFTQLRNLHNELIKSFESISEIFPDAVEIRDVEEAGPKAREYLFHRDVIELVLGSMPPEVEASFLPISKFTLSIISDAEFQRFLTKLEESYK